MRVEAIEGGRYCVVEVSAAEEKWSARVLLALSLSR